jgi:hypothetical protein
MTRLASYNTLLVWERVITAPLLVNVEVFPVSFGLRTPPAVMATIPAPRFELLPRRD